MRERGTDSVSCLLGTNWRCNQQEILIGLLMSLLVSLTLLRIFPGNSMPTGLAMSFGTVCPLLFVICLI